MTEISKPQLLKVVAITKNWVKRGLFRCDCGEEFEALLPNVKNGNTRSCGCFHRKVIAGNTYATRSVKKPRQRPTSTYQSWTAMRKRCNTPAASGYKYYGGRGIKVCARWQNDFAKFLEDMGERPAGMSLDRIDPNGNYEPDNCRWATQKQQNRNRRNSRFYSFGDDKLTLPEMHEVLGAAIPYSTVKARIRRGVSVDLAFSEGRI